MAKEQTVKLTSPIGSCNWFKLVNPDTKFNKYSVDLIVEDSAELQNIINQIEEMTAARVQLAKTESKNPQAAAKAKDSGNRPIEKQLDSEGKHTGKYIMKFRLSSEGRKKDDTIYKVASPALFNSKNQPLSTADKNALQVPNGSLIQVSFELSSYFVQASGAGVSMKPRAAKIHKIQSMADISQFGFSPSEFKDEDEETFETKSESFEEFQKNEDMNSDF